jgi:O-antigen ligase
VFLYVSDKAAWHLFALNGFRTVATAQLPVEAEFVSNRRRFGLLFLLCGMDCALIVVRPNLGLGIAVVGAASFVLLYLLHGTLYGNVGPAILTWSFIFPLGYYFLSFPRVKTIVTLDRALLVILLLTMVRASSKISERVPNALKQPAIAWAVFLGMAAVSLMRGGDAFTSGRLFIDSFCLPALLGWCVIRNFDVRRHIKTLTIAASMMAAYVACIGAAEVVLKEDLLPLPGSAIFFAGSVTRPNGPFYSFDSFALIGVVTLFLLLFLRAATRAEHTPFWHSVAHGIGVTASLAMSLMPMFRAIGIALMLILLIATWSDCRPSRRVAGFGLLLLCVITVSLISALAPDAFEDRSKPDNFYARMAEQVQTLQVFTSHPILGVGLGRFTNTVEGRTEYLTFYQGLRSVDSPHNNLGQILAETGALGFIPYVAAQVLLFCAFWTVRRRNTPDSRLVWKYFLYLFLGYWISGMSGASGFNSDVNLWYVFAISVLYKYQMTDTAIPQPVIRFAERQEYSYA